MPRFDFTNITPQSKVSITDIMDNFNKIEQLAALSSEVARDLNSLQGMIESIEADLRKVATQSANGMMSKNDKIKLDGVAENANNYSLPTAAKNILGGVKTNSSVTDSSGYTAVPIINGIPYYKDTNTTYTAATQSANGLMSSTDKKKLDGIAEGANKYTLPTAAKGTLGGVKTNSSVTDITGYTAVPIVNGIPYYKDTNTTYGVATKDANGLMSKADFTKLDGIATGANKTIIVDNLTSSATESALSAAQGKKLKGLVDEKQKTISVGTSAPASTFGANGDIYIQYFT